MDNGKTNKPITAYDIDFRRDWLWTILDALETGFTSIAEMEKEIPWFDGGWAIEHLESIYGIAFVSVQTYILGTVQDINRIRQNSGKEPIDKIKYFADDPTPLDNRVSRIRLMNSIANYYKHQDEWVGWPNNYTTQDLSTVGIDENTDFPCYTMALQLLQGENIKKLNHLTQIVSSWREYILKNYRRV